MTNNPNLSQAARAVLFDKATEAPFSGKLLSEKRDGQFVCANCKAPLFSASNKFDSNCGWPSFDQAIEGAIDYREDNSIGMLRVETSCANCGGHLGHVFDDGPCQTTGRRYCINSLALGFEPK